MRLDVAIRSFIFSISISLLAGAETLSAQLRFDPVPEIGTKVTCYGASTPKTLPVIHGAFNFAPVDRPQSNEDVRRIFNDVNTHTGIYAPVYVVAVKDDEGNAQACRGDHGAFLILYNPTWLLKFYDDTKTIWTVRAIIAHELGHIALNHVTLASGSTLDMEIAADRYAGKILGRMGAELSMVEQAFRSKRICSADSSTHPDLRVRLAAVKAGWSAVSNKTLSSYPNVNRNGEGKLSPASGYRWVKDSDPTDYRVELMSGLTKTGNTYKPGSGYQWVNKDDPKDFRVEMIPGLTKNGTKFHPASGYQWINQDDPKDFRVEMIPGLTKNGSKFHPASGYQWVNKDDPKDFRVEMIPGLTKNGSKFHPASGYQWVNKDDPKDLRVELMPGLTKNGSNYKPQAGYDWVNKDDPKDYRVRPVSP